MPEKFITQRVQGYNNQPVTVTVQIDGNILLQGSVPTENISPPTLPNLSTDVGINAWSWTVDADFNGTQTLTVSVDDGILLLCDTFYTLSDQPGNVYPLVLKQTQGNLDFYDPFTAVSINGVAMDPIREPELDGQWIWQLQAGDEFTCTVNIVSGPQ